MADQNTRQGNRKKAFTLIEMLVVIAIIVLLIGLITPVVNSAVRRARSTACLSNLRNIIIATHSYAVENSGEFPSLFLVGGVPGNYMANTGAGGAHQRFELTMQGWPTALEPYLGDLMGVVYSPLDPRVDARRRNDAPGAQVSYRFRHAFNVFSTLIERPVRMYDFGFPNRQVAYNQVRDWGGNDLGFFNTVEGERIVNAAFVDGSVRTYTGFTQSVNVRGRFDYNFMFAGEGPDWDVRVSYDPPDI